MVVGVLALVTVGAGAQESTLKALDMGGAVIEKITKRSTWEGEAKAYEFEHPVLSYVLPLIDQVRIAMEAKLD